MFFSVNFSKKFIFLSLLTIFCKNYAKEDVFAVESMSFNADVLKSIQIPVPEIKLDSENAQYSDIAKELDALKTANTGVDFIDLEEEKNQKITPILYNIISKIVKKFAKDSGVKLPKLCLYVGNDNKTYNASATNGMLEKTTTKQITEKGQTRIETNVDYEKVYKLTLGENLIKLFFWTNNGINYLKSTIAHEFGHMINFHTEESIDNEYQADTTGAKLLGKTEYKNLMPAIDSITFASHMRGIFESNASLFKIKDMEQIHQLIRIMTALVITQYPDLGKLGMSSTHLEYGTKIFQAFQKSINMSFDPKVGLTEKDITNIYQNLFTICDLKFTNNSEKEVQEKALTEKCEEVESYNNKFFSPLTHPAPLARRENLAKIIF